MKYIILSLSLIILISIISCSKQKSVIEQLDINEVSILIKQDSLYETVIQDVEKIRDVFEKDLVVKSKFKDFTYEDFLNYNKMLSDSTFQKNLYEKVEKEFNTEMDSLLIKYQTSIDEKMTYYKKQKELLNPANFFSVKFSGIDKEYYNSMREVKKIDVEFRITPLKGAIQGGSFRYKVIPKVIKRAVVSAGCRFSSYTKSSSVYVWEAPYDVEDEFENKTTDSIKENYNFEYEILTVRVAGKTYSFDDIDIPFSYKYYMEKDSLSYFEYASLIEEEFQIKSLSYFNIFDQALIKEKQKINKIAYELEEIINKKSE